MYRKLRKKKTKPKAITRIIWEETNRAQRQPAVLWAYRTTTRKPTGVSPFALTYRMEAVIPTEIGLPTIRTATLEPENEGSMIRELDTSDELREAAAVQVASYQRCLANSYNKQVRPRVFQPSDLVLRKVFENSADPTAGKFQPN